MAQAMQMARKDADPAAALREQYGCGPVQLAGNADGLYERHLVFDGVIDPSAAGPRERFEAFARSVRDVLSQRWVRTERTYERENPKRIYYLSMEFLIGRSLANNVMNLLLDPLAKQVVAQQDLDWLGLLEQEPDAGLGNGGLGRLAACFLDSMATMQLPAMGYGVRYEYGMFRQSIEDGWQRERPDNWLRRPDPWEVARPDERVEIALNCSFEVRGGALHAIPGRPSTLIGMPFDRPVVGYGGKTINTLRLWAAAAHDYFDFQEFSHGDFVGALAETLGAESLTRVLYPDDSTTQGQGLRFVQEYFLVACSLADLVRRFRRSNADWSELPDRVAIQLNDTHPTMAVPELMRILLDEAKLGWDHAWDLTQRTLAYTNHTLLPEALEKWSVGLFERVLPRHLQIIYDINTHLMKLVEGQWPGDDAKKRVCSLIEENGGRMVRMANLAVAGCHAVNGVAALHTELLKKDLFPDFNQLYPGKFQNKTNGITPRRWLLKSNPRLAALITRTLPGADWPRDLDRLQDLAKHAGDAAFQREFMAIKRANKVDLAAVIKQQCGVDVSADALFDVQIKRLHEYKRQHLNLLHILALYRRLVQNPALDIVPRVFIFAAKAAPGYDLAKNIIYAINAIGAHVNADARIGGKLKVAFLPNYRVSLAEKIIPAADLSEQISTAGKEASGTGNMKLALNGALTIGTLDGANVEIKEEVGEENIFIFGLNVDEVAALDARGYHPQDYYNADEELRAVIDWLGSSYFTPGESGAFGALHHSLLAGGDPYKVLADFRSYCDAQARVDAAYRDHAKWAKMAILNTAHMGRFSSDRTIREYASEIWDLPAVPVI